jgi:hypothetical protein
MGIMAVSVSYAVALPSRGPAALGPIINVASQPLAIIMAVLATLCVFRATRLFAHRVR